MITNAAITQINPAIDATPGGDAQFATGEPVAIRCCLTTPMAGQRFQINQLQLDATNVIYIPIEDVKGIPFTGAQILVQIDGETQPFPYLVRKNAGEIKAGGLSHVALYCRGA